MRNNALTKLPNSMKRRILKCIAKTIERLIKRTKDELKTAKGFKKTQLYRELHTYNIVSICLMMEIRELLRIPPPDSFKVLTYPSECDPMEGAEYCGEPIRSKPIARTRKGA